MLIEQTRVKISELNEKNFPFAPLESMGPNLAGWGVVETTLLLPNSICLMVGPLACLRHSSFMSHARNFYGRFYMLNIDEIDIIMGKHFSKVEEAILKISKKEKPEILILAGTCCDYLLESDYTDVVENMKKKLNIEIIYTVMAPLTIGLKPSPFELAYQSLIDILKDKKTEINKNSVNILGTFIPLKEDSELLVFLKKLGYENIYQIPTLKNVHDLYKLSSASLNIVIHPLGLLLAKKMYNELDIPYIFAPVSYDILEIKKQYSKIEEITNKKINIKEKNNENLISKNKFIKNKNIAVGSSVYGNPLELALALTKLGGNVKAVFLRNSPKLHEKEYINELSKISPETYIYNVSHPYLNENINFFNDIELAFGVDAGIFCQNAVNIPLSRYQHSFYGYENLKNLLDSIQENIKNPISNYDWIYKYNYLI
ncbi:MULTISPECIES: nitrogenase component 1 [unclassified Lebetimonas]|uniref:nitrogenase component 1 n=1 Tax=unclassified Lebetimonas TaxID=2648158 RepID=UPI000465E0F8|nr:MULTISPECIES: nitrogenase component 1 [unclassified Lebetimonas]